MQRSQAIGPYQVVRELGRGGMGVVYEVRHPDVTRALLVHLTPSRRALMEARVERLERKQR